MSDVVAVTPVADASSPSHPDHARWVKDKTLRMEVEHAKLLGGTLRDAENENDRLLEQMEARARTEKPALPKASPAPDPDRRARRVAERGVTIRKPKPILAAAQLSPCGRCGKCHACMRERRVFAVIQKANEGDLVCAQAVWQLAMRLQGLKGKFPNRRDAARAGDALIEKFCDDSVRSFGPWR